MIVARSSTAAAQAAARAHAPVVLPAAADFPEVFQLLFGSVFVGAQRREEGVVVLVRLAFVDAARKHGDADRLLLQHVPDD